MRKWLLVFLVLCALSHGAGAQFPPRGYIGLFTDEFHNEWCAVGAGFYEVYMWVWCLPGERGMFCAEFAVSYPTNVIQSAMTWHPDFPMVIEPPYPEEGISLCYLSCKWDWVWVFYQQLWVTDMMPAYVEIVKHSDPGISDIQFANCEPGYPVEPVTKYTNLYINYDPASSECLGTAVETASWGTIKNLMVR